MIGLYPPRESDRAPEVAISKAGFTMMEMMVVLGIVAILVLMAVPTYQDKFIRDQIVEALPLADIAKPPVSASWTALRSFPADNAAAGLPCAAMPRDRGK